MTTTILHCCLKVSYGTSHHSKHYERSAYLAGTLLVYNQPRWSIYSIERISIKIRTKERPEAILPDESYIQNLARIREYSFAFLTGK